MNLLITGAWREATEHIPELETAGHHIQFQQWEKDPLECEYEWVEGVICNALFLHHSITRFVNLRYIQVTSAGNDRVPLEYIEEHEIEYYNARGVYSIPMAEYAVSGVLQLYKRTKDFSDNQREHKWEKIRNLQELYGKTVCIVGCGSVGTECAKRFQAFGCRVIEIRKRDTWDQLLTETDVLILSVPLTEETTHLINYEKFVKMKQSAVIINLSRGAVVDTDALIKALRFGQISGAVLDVFEEEPLDEGSVLWDMENVILSPHNSYVGEGNRDRLMEHIFKNLANYTNR